MKKNKIEIIDHLGNIDLFVCSSGFESRSSFLGSSLNSSKVKDSVVFHLDETYAIANKNIELIKENLKSLRTIIYPKNESILTFDIFYNFFLDYVDEDEKVNVVIDITTFTKEVLLIIFKVVSLQKFADTFIINLVYTPAESYPDWLTKGVREIRSVYGYSGLHYPSKELLLIILNGFENERTEEIINSFEPNGILLGRPTRIDSINDGLSVISDEKYNYINSRYESLILENFDFSCQDISKTKNLLSELVKKYSQDYNIVISPLNNKVSTLGVASLGIQNEDIQICYASANQYNINSYSKGCDYFLVFNFNDLLKY
ncbi:hypothetical protein D6T69_06885 [Tenacibaculum singaporense]|uniref:Uncharacterized protein n=1 Tax=Tenacibaculum singaporense TaxID=2358479 RepID=A0A3Q8RMG6_9FLAO|nr:hypothetical protein [Tenacibaculum singaporense]AZJ35257.1 hypothetical protein D6T69_06885 [Tenacibaculum singaporense]